MKISEIRGFGKAIDFARMSEGNNYKVGAAIFKGSRFISGGCSAEKTHPNGRTTELDGVETAYA
jgi:hypothetical protein